MAGILVVEDDIVFGQMLKSWLLKKGFEAGIVTSVSAAQRLFETTSFDLVLSDLRLPDSDGILLLQWIKEHHPSVHVIIMTSYADIQTAVSAIKLGAFDYLEKPVQPDLLIGKITSAIAKKTTAAEPLSKQKRPPKVLNGFIKGTDKVSEKLYEHLVLVAPTNMSVLVMGESGTGKEYVAKFIHEHSKRKDKPFIAVDCGAISRELGFSELFGHVKGSFTSAVSDKRGVFEEAAGGTVFLDEIGNLAYDVQVQLLRALQERKVRPVGSSKEIIVDVRVISATNVNLQKAIEEGKFREDIYHRINEFSVQVPALRERSDDIMTFARFFLQQANQELEKNVTGFSPDVEELFSMYYWSGNLRQMRNVVKRAVLFCRKNEISLDDLPNEMVEEGATKTPLKRTDERELIVAALEKAKSNKSKAAKLLYIDRKTLYNKMKQYGLEL